MLYIICALKSEAQAFVEKCKLLKTNQNDKLIFSRFSNEAVLVVISGIGSGNMFNATKDIVDIMNDSDTIINVGICGGSRKFYIGELVDGFKKNLTCVNHEIFEADNYEIVDMESAGFIRATQDIKNRYIFKVVSDHFEPNKVTKDGTKKFIYDKIDEIMKKVAM